VRQRPLFFALSVALGLAHAASAQDFDPRGRSRKPKPPVTSPGPKPGAKPGPTTSAPKPATEQPAAGEAAQIDRYTGIVLAQPGAAFPLQKLVQLYRERDGNLQALVSDFEKRAAQDGPNRYGAMVGLAGIYKLDGRADDAIAAFDKAIAVKASDPAALLSLARLLQDRGNIAGARTRYEQALALQTTNLDREQTLRTLMTLALDAKDFDNARGSHERLLKLQPTSLFVRGELGRELFARGEYERAEKEFLELVQAAAGDNRALAPALKELGRAQAKAGKRAPALATLRRALGVAGSEAAVRAELYEIITEVYRAEQRLPELVKELEAEHPNDFARLSLLGALYEETGDSANAIKTYRRALGIQPRHIDLRLKLVRLLQSQGELDQAIVEYEGLIRAAPNNPQFVFEQCDALMQRGDRPRALKLLNELEARGSNDEDVLGRLADFYGRIGEADKALRVLTKLAQVSTNDPGHLVDLGARYFQDGNQQLALQTWKRILTTVTPRARALAAYGDVLLEHDMVADALNALREAVQLDRDNVQYKKQLAGAYERAKNFREAQALWLDIAERAKKTNDRLLARDVRTHLVTLWALERSLEQRVAPYAARFAGTPPDLDAGRTLAEIQLHLRRLADAETTLRRLVQLAPGDPDGYLALERVLVQANKKEAAIPVVERLIVVDPKQGRGGYDRMAQYARETFHGDDAIRYQKRALELNPEDAERHRRLADEYRQRQDLDLAIASYRAALAKNERLYPVYMDLADCLLSQGQTEEADRQLRRLIRSAPDEELVANAVRRSIQINLGKSTLESLEQDLLPLSIGNPQKTIYRRLLMEVYESLTFGLLEQSRRGDAKAREAARESLARIGARAIKPLLDALASGDAGQQRIAIGVLSYVENKNAGPALFAFATGGAEVDLRTRAMIACGMLRSPAMRERYESLLLPKGARAEDGTPTDQVAVAAVFALARLEDKRAAAALRALMKRGTPEMRAVAALGAAALKDRAALPDLLALARSLEAGLVARAAAAYAIGELGPDADAASTLVSMAQGTDALPRQLALVALGRAGALRGNEAPGGRAALDAMTAAVFDTTPGEGSRTQRASSVSRAGSAALMLLASPGAVKRSENALAAVETTLDIEALLGSLVPTEFTDVERAKAVTTFGDALERGAAAALRTSGDRAQVVFDAIGAGDGALRPFFGVESTPALETAHQRARALARALESAAVGLVRHPDATIRTKALQLLAGSSSDEANAAVLRAVEDPNEAVQRMALATVGRHGSSAAIQACGRVLFGSESWAIRVLAAEALGRLGAWGGTEASPLLERAAKQDAYALVREAALRAMAFDPRALERVARGVATEDPEPRVREVANRLLHNPAQP
jgi:tetratricopeptide (TPR) repeat protein